MQKLENISTLESLEFFAKNLVEGFITGKHKSPFHGFSVEFAEHKLYNKGESTKHIDWKLYARTDKLFVKNFEEETNLRCQIIIDTSSSMYYPLIKNPDLFRPNKILYSVLAAASLMNLFKKQRDSVGLSLFSDNLHFHSNNKGTNKHHMLLKSKMVEVLNNSNDFINTSTIDSVHQIASRIQKRSLVLIFTDMLEGIEDLSEIFLAFQHLKFQKHEVVLFHLKDKKTEINLEFPNTPHNFIDIETKEEVRLNPIEIRESFIEKTDLFLKDLKLMCLQHKIDLVEVDINKGIEQILISYLLKRQKMF